MIGTIFEMFIFTSVICTILVVAALGLIRLIKWSVDHPGTEKILLVIFTWVLSFIVVVETYVEMSGG